MQGRDVLSLWRWREAGVLGQVRWDLFNQLGTGGCGNEDWSLSHGEEVEHMREINGRADPTQGASPR